MRPFTIALKLISGNLSDADFVMTERGTNCDEVCFEDERGGLISVSAL